MSIRVGNNFWRGVIPQTPLFSTYLSPPALAEESSPMISGTLSSTSMLIGAPPTTPLWTGNSPPNTAMGSTVTRTVNERSILDRRKSVRRQGAQITPNFMRKQGTGMCVISETVTSSTDLRGRTGNLWYASVHAYGRGGPDGNIEGSNKRQKMCGHHMVKPVFLSSAYYSPPPDG